MDEKSDNNCIDFDDALKKCGFGKFNYTIILLAGGLLGCAFLNLTSIKIIFPVAQCDLNFSTSDKGILSGVGYVGVILSSHLWGFLSDTKGRRSPLIASLLVASISCFVSSIASNFWVLVCLRFLTGYFISCASSTTFAYLGEFHDAKNQGRVLMIASIFYSAITLLLPTFAIFTLNQEWSFQVFGITYKPWRLFLLICGVPNLICALILILVLPESPKYTFSQGNEAKTLKIFQKMYQMNTGKSAESFEVTGIYPNEEFNESNQCKSEDFFKQMRNQTSLLFKKSHLRNTLTACFIQFAVASTANGFFTFYPEILNKVSLWTKTSTKEPAAICEIFNWKNQKLNETLCVSKLETSTYINLYETLTAYGIGFMIISLCINRTGKLVILLAILFASVIAAVLLILVEIPTISLYLYLIMLLSGLSITVINASTIELFPTNLRAMAVSLSMMVGRCGSVFGSFVIGFLINHHCFTIFLIPTVLLTISGVLTFTIPNISKKVMKQNKQNNQ